MADEDQKELVIKLSGEITIRTISDSWNNLRDAFQSADSIVADLSELGATDMSFIQLLLSARRTAVQHHKDFRLSAPVTGDIRETLTRGGFLEEPAGERAFWLQETEDTHG